jgi:hypothetical protein
LRRRIEEKKERWIMEQNLENVFGKGTISAAGQGGITAEAAKGFAAVASSINLSGRLGRGTGKQTTGMRR